MRGIGVLLISIYVVWLEVDIWGSENGKVDVRYN